MQIYGTNHLILLKRERERERERERDAYMHIGPRYILGKLGAILKDST